mmetsp:Transcript_7087/g.21172  ORF Transcript_7087/g.21172 Transcript_7087/m.21172 type:complete len:108 (-) Transcript_7087:20-343(-)
MVAASGGLRKSLTLLTHDSAALRKTALMTSTSTMEILLSSLRLCLADIVTATVESMDGGSFDYGNSDDFSASYGPVSIVALLEILCRIERDQEQQALGNKQSHGDTM